MSIEFAKDIKYTNNPPSVLVKLFSQLKRCHSSLVIVNYIRVPGQPRSSRLPPQVAPFAGKSQVLIDSTCAKRV